MLKINGLPSSPARRNFPNFLRVALGGNFLDDSSKALGINHLLVNMQIPRIENGIVSGV